MPAIGEVKGSAYSSESVPYSLRFGAFTGIGRGQRLWFDSCGCLDPKSCGSAGSRQGAGAHRRAGTSFRRELKAVRYQVARELLANTKLPLARIAAALNYADTSAFIRAFRQWSGIPPAAWRRRHGHP
ncbi:MAG: AraC family transcriptional regulator [Gammaproteobacteria bacterium]